MYICPVGFNKKNINLKLTLETLKSKGLKELYGNSMRENVRLKEIIETQQKILDDKNVYISELETKIAESREVIVVDVGK